jgi:hypothetical protein
MSEGLRPNVSLGIVPAHIERTMWSSPGFWMFDDEEVVIETATAALTISQPREVEVYSRVFAALSGRALEVAEQRVELVVSQQPSLPSRPPHKSRVRPDSFPRIDTLKCNIPVSK